MENTARTSSHAQLGLGSGHYDLSEEEARLHLAGKQGDTLARLMSTLLDIKRRHQSNPSLVAMIDRSIHDLKTMRHRRRSSFEIERAH